MTIINLKKSCIGLILFFIAGLAHAVCTETGGGTQIFSCLLESDYRAKLTELGYGSFTESFEGTEWDGVRSSLITNSAPEITSKGITWTSNHPLETQITTSAGPALTGNWGAFDASHGFVTGSVLDCTDPPADADLEALGCLYHDGLSGEIVPGGDSLHGVGGYITGAAGANIAIILDGTTQVTVGKLPDSLHYFFGLIDAGAVGFTRFEFRELDGKINQRRSISADDFIIASSGPLPGNTPPTQPGTLLASAITGNSATVSWGASTDADPADTITYLVEYRRNGELPWTSGGTTTTTSQALTGLDPAQSYDVQVTPNDGTDDGTARTKLNLFQTFATGDIIFGDGFEGNP
jgi:hypothetical protein